MPTRPTILFNFLVEIRWNEPTLLTETLLDEVDAEDPLLWVLVEPLVETDLQFVRTWDKTRRRTPLIRYKP